jgi:Rho-binding antiterminator
MQVAAGQAIAQNLIFLSILWSMTNIAYRPISCTFHQYLETWARQQQACKIQYRQNDGSAIEVSSEIIDLFSWQGAQYILIEKGQLIRIDRLLSVNDTSSSGIEG